MAGNGRSKAHGSGGNRGLNHGSVAVAEDNASSAESADTPPDPAFDADAYYGDNTLAADVLRNKYLAPGETGPFQMWDRVARAMASVEQEQGRWYQAFFSILKDFKFIPGGRVMHGAGRQDARRQPTLSNCFVGGTLITTDAGHKPIEEICPGDRVLTHAGAFRPVLRTAAREADEPVYTLRVFYNATPVEVTGEHPFLALRDGQVQWITAADLTTRDHIALPGIVKDEKAVPERLSLRDYVTPSVHQDGDVLYMVRNFVRNNANCSSESSRVHATIPVDNAFNRFLGYFMAEGGVLKVGEAYRSVYLTFHSDEKDYLQDVLTLGKALFGVEGRLNAREGQTGAWSRVYFFNPLLAEFFDRAFGGRSAKTKRLPAWFIHQDRYALSQFICGLFRGDVYRHTQSKTEALGFGLVMANPELMRQVYLILLDLGILGSLNQDYDNGPFQKSPTAKITVCVRPSVEALSAIIAGTPKHATGRVEVPHVHGYKVSGGRFFVKVRSISSERRQERVYNFAVEGDESYVANFLGVHNCYVIPIEEDSLEGIYRCLTESALVYRTGGGVGTDLSILRPKGSPVNATVDRSPGSTAFMHLLSESTNTVAQAGRRGALMLTLRVDHPDVEDFIVIKNDPRRIKVQYANISVLATDEFMEAVIHDRDFDLRWGGKAYKTVRARDLWDRIIRNAHASAEPGVIFWDRMKAYHNVEYVHPLTSTNPCGEQPLASYTACNLGNINLLRFVREDGTFDHEALKQTARIATRFMDNIIAYNMPNHALPKIQEAVASDRRVGLGITGLGDALLAMRIRYDSEEALRATEEIMQTICYEAYDESVELAKERGAFPTFDWEGYSKSEFIRRLPQELQEKIKKHGIRNGTVITVPPVGTGSIVAETSSGVEPIFCTSYRRRVKQADGESFREYKVYHPLVQKLFGDDENLPDYVRTAHQIDPYFRVKLQGVIQKYVDSAISSTINLPQDISLETVADIYITAYKEGLKGVTVYREGSREGILQTDDFAAQKEPKSESAPAAPGKGYHPRQRPAVTHGVTIRVRTGEGNLYLTINEDDQGLCEVFSTIGKAGGNAAAQTEAISRLISLCLRSGIDPREVVKELKGISGPSPVWENGQLILSTPDAIGKALENHLDMREGKTPQQMEDEKKNGEPVKQAPVLGNGGDANAPLTGVRPLVTCPECGSSVTHETGCLVCRNCGWSKC